MVDWYNLCREVCDVMFSIRTAMGGAGETVHVDEYLCTEKDSKTIDLEAKNGTIPDNDNPMKNYGSRIEGPWVLAVCWKRQDKVVENRFFIVSRRDAETLLPIIENEVHPGTTVLTDKWSAYQSLRDLGYIHETFKKSKVFIDPDTGKRTKSIDRLWDHVQRKFNIKANGKNYLSLQLREEWWRSCNPTDTFNAFLRDMKRVYCTDDHEESLVTLLGES